MPTRIWTNRMTVMRQLSPEERLRIEEQMLREMAARYAALLEQDRRNRMAVEQQMELKPLELIKVEQLPKFTEQLHTIKEQWEAVAAECEALACTDETLQSVKARRADINKAFDVLEARRKAVKQVVMTPYNQLEDVYRECVTLPHEKAEAALKKKITDTEDGIKGACETRMRAYFTEQCQREHIDWLTWEMGGFKIDMASARAKVPAKLMGTIADFVIRVAQEVKTIEGMDFAAEIMDEYKRTRNFGCAVDMVQSRHQRIEEEKQAAAARAEKLRQEQEAVAKVEAAAPPASTPLAPPKAASPAPKGPEFPESFGFVMHFTSKAQWDAVRPLLVELKKAIQKEGIRVE